MCRVRLDTAVPAAEESFQNVVSATGKNPDK